MWKYFVVVFFVCSAFQIASSQSENKIICEGRTSSIQCASSIQIIAATYGRTAANAPGCFQRSVTNCSLDVLDSVGNLCDGKRVCNIEAANRLFGDPCRNIRKYLNITFMCTGRLLTTPEGSSEMSTSEEPISGSSEMSTSEEPISRSPSVSETRTSEGTIKTPNNEESESITIGVAVGVSTAVFLVAILVASFVLVIVIRKRRSKLASEKTDEYHMYEGEKTQTAPVKPKTGTEYTEVSGFNYSHKYENLQPTTTDSDGYLNSIGIYENDKLSGKPIKTEDVYDYINESTIKNETEQTSEYLDLGATYEGHQYQELK